MQGTALSAEEQAALVARIRSGDPSAEEDLVRLFSPKVFVMTLARTHDPEAARELVQEVMMAAIRALRNGRLQETNKLAAFVHGTARNLVNNYLRARTQQPKLDSLSPDLIGAIPTETLEATQRAELVGRALERLAPIERKILLLTLVEGLKPGEIASRLGLKPEVVRTRKHRAVQQVIERIKKMSQK